MRLRHWYRLSLATGKPFVHPPRVEVQMRPPTGADTHALAELMIDSYHGTIDYDGETIEDALAEVQGYFAGRNAQPLLECSWLGDVDGALVTACLVGWWAKGQVPIIAYVMTGAAWKGRGLAGVALRASLSSLVQRGDSDVRALITAGNTPSEQLHFRAGFTRVDDGD